MATETSSHILCKCVTLAEFRFRRLGKYFYVTKRPGGDSVMKILHILRGTELLAE
jgi:hypothetical protein